MVNLSYENFIKARDYIFAHCDDINRAWFRCHFEGNDAVAFGRAGAVSARKRRLWRAGV
jgi:hypothetical protein